LPGWSGVWQWASTDGHRFPDIVFACAGATPTVDTLPPYGCPSFASRQRFDRLGVEQQHRGGTLPYLGPYFAAKAAMDALAVSYVAALARFGIETSIIVPGAFTTGTNRFAHGGHPADQAIVEAYEQQYAGLMEQVSQRLAALAPADADVTAVSDAINTVVDAPEGTRPFRTHIDPANDGAEEVAAVADRIRVEFLQRVRLDDILHPARRVPHASDTFQR
jgi:hypothetical protein